MCARERERVVCVCEIVGGVRERMCVCVREREKERVTCMCVFECVRESGMCE